MRSGVRYTEFYAVPVDTEGINQLISKYTSFLEILIIEIDKQFYQNRKQMTLKNIKYLKIKTSPN